MTITAPPELESSADTVERPNNIFMRQKTRGDGVPRATATTAAAEETDYKVDKHNSLTRQETLTELVVALVLARLVIFSDPSRRPASLQNP